MGHGKAAAKREDNLTAENANYAKGNRIVGAGLKPALLDDSARQKHLSNMHKPSSIAIQRKQGNALSSSRALGSDRF